MTCSTAMSSFRRFLPLGSQIGASGNARLSGTKSWLSGQSLISTGCSDLDAALGAGLPLGSVTIITEDLYSNQMKTFEKLFISEGIHSKQQVLIISSLPKELLDRFISKLPSRKDISKPAKEAPEPSSVTSTESDFPMISAFSKPLGSKRPCRFTSAALTQ